MDIAEVYGRVVNLSIQKGMISSLKFLKLNEKKIEEKLTKGRMIEEKSFDIVLDFKPKINQLYIYLSPKKSSKKLVKSLKPNSLDFKSLVIYIGDLLLFGKRTQVRLGACGPSSSELARAVIEYKKV